MNVTDAPCDCPDYDRLRAELAAAVAEAGRLRAALNDAREFVSGMVKPATCPTVLTISSYHPCHALLDKIDAALGNQEQKAAPCDDAEFGMKP